MRLGEARIRRARGVSRRERCRPHETWPSKLRATSPRSVRRQLELDLVDLANDLGERRPRSGIFQASYVVFAVRSVSREANASRADRARVSDAAR